MKITIICVIVTRIGRETIVTQGRELTLGGEIHEFPHRATENREFYSPLNAQSSRLY